MSARDNVARRETDGRGTASGSPSQIVRPISYTINDAKQVSGLGRTTIYKAISDKRLEAVKVCGRTLVLADSLEALIKGGTHA